MLLTRFSPVSKGSLPSKCFNLKKIIPTIFNASKRFNIQNNLVANTKITEKYMNLPISEIQAEYIWIGGTGLDFRTKSRTFESGSIDSLDDLPNWAYDGSSTGQASGTHSEIKLKPVKYIKDPIRGGQHILVLCETLNPKDDTPIPGNNRAYAEKIFNNSIVQDEEPWFGLEQEYTILDGQSRRPFLWPPFGFPAPQGQYYCAVGGGNVFGRDIVEAHYRACLYSGLMVGGTNAEVMPSQWEYQIGPVTGIDASDQLWLARYLMQRIAEDYGGYITLNPKPMPGDWNGTGGHCNFSTKSMRSDGGYELILSCMEKLENTHKEHMDLYGAGNEERMTGKHETAHYNEFTWAVGSRGVSVRIHNSTKRDGKGFFEDRRPAANMDPYLVTAKLVETCVLKNELFV